MLLSDRARKLQEDQMKDVNEATPRRSFMGRMVAIGASIAGVGMLRDVSTLDATTTRLPGGPDDVWLSRLTGKHKTTFDVDTHKNGTALTQGKNFLDAWRDVFGVPETQISLVMAVRGTGIPIVLRDDVWARYRIGEQYGIMDPAAKGTSVRNVFTNANLQAGGPVTAERTVEALQQRGVIFLVCRNTIAGATKKLVAAGMGTTAQVHDTLTSGMLPNVIIVPAMVVAFTEMQERGVAYVYAG
jgi:intracellular sulfur oxidation DsrE/DsrF family protein